MSFILDALKKSENERARQNGPVLLQARVAPPRRGVPAWAIVVGAVLAANLALLSWVVLRVPRNAAADGNAPQPAVAAAVPTPAPAPATAPAPAPAPAQPVGAASAPAVPPQAAAPAPIAMQPPPPVIQAPPPGAAVVNPADFAPARPAGTLPRPVPPPSSAPQSAGVNGSEALDSSLPTASDLTANGSGLPELRLALHAWDNDPANRYVLINSQRLHEGETMTEGARVERIVPEGVLMSWRGQHFRLLPGQ